MLQLIGCIASINAIQLESKFPLSLKPYLDVTDNGHLMGVISRKLQTIRVLNYHYLIFKPH